RCARTVPLVRCLDMNGLTALMVVSVLLSPFIDELAREVWSMDKRAEDHEDTRQTLHDLMGRRWKVSLLTGPLTIRQTVQARNDGTLAIREMKMRSDDQRGLAIYDLAQPEQVMVLSPSGALELFGYLLEHETQLREMANADTQAIESLRQRIER